MTLTLLAPGIYANDEGEVHIDLTMVLRSLGLPDTPEQRQSVLQGVRDAAHLLQVPITEEE